MSEISVIMTSDEHRAYQALMKLTEGLSKAEGGVKKVNAAAKDFETQQLAASKKAQQVWEETRTPMERHGEKLVQLRDLLKQNLITQETYGRAANQSFEQATHSSQNYHRALESGVDRVREMAMALTGVGGVMWAVEQVKDAYWSWREHIKQLGEEHHKFAKEFVVDLSKIGDKYHELELSGWMKDVSGGALPEQKRQIFKGVTEAESGTALDSRKKLTDLTLRAIPLLGENELEGFGHLVGKLQAPGRSEQATVSLAWKARELARAHSDQVGNDRFEKNIHTLMGAGMDEEGAMGMLLASWEQGEKRGGAFVSATEAVDKDYDLQSMHAKTKEQRLKRQFAQASRGERWRLLREDKEVREAILGDKAAQFAGFDFAKGAAFGQELRQAEKGDAIAEALGRAEKTPEGLETIESQKLAAEKYKNAAPFRERGSRLSRAQERYDTIMANRPWYLTMIQGPEWAMDTAAHPEHPERAFAQSLGEYMVPKPGGGQQTIQQWAESAEKEEALIAEAKRQTQALQSIDKKMSSPSPAAVQNNRSQHGEQK